MVKGPKGKFNYTKDLSPHLLMIAGGTGITPMYQIIKSSVMDPNDKTEIELIYANVDEGDIRECFTATRLRHPGYQKLDLVTVAMLTGSSP